MHVAAVNNTFVCTISPVMKKTLISLQLLFLFLLPSMIYAQTAGNDSIKIDYKKIYGFALNGNIKAALDLLPKETTQKISYKDKAFTANFKNRFAYDQDKSDYLPKEDTSINGLLNVYRNYWRSSLLNNSRRYDTALFLSLISYLQNVYTPSKAIDLKAGGPAIASSVAKYLKEFIDLKGMHTTGFGRTGSYLDLLIWEKQVDTVYNLTLDGDPVAVHVIFMDDFISLGWEEYATLGRHYPGGWTTKEALYCVRKAYDLTSEEFNVGYLAHEGRHFADYILFPKLASPDLEYRAKLTQLSLEKENIYSTIEFFINSSNYESTNSHSIANFCVIRDLSKKLFKNDFEKDMAKWKLIPVKKIHKESKKLLQKNTKDLNKRGKDVDYFIKEKRA
jgi:hypothetical protein